MAHEEPTAVIIRVMTRLGDPAVVGGQKVTDLGHDTNAVRAGYDQAKSTHGKLQRNRKVGHSSHSARKLQYS
ncbi:hypothetical protein D9M68_828830 [compost metagenome]